MLLCAYSLLLLLHCSCAPLLLLCFIVVFLTSLLLLLCYSSLVHCCYVVFCHSSMLCYSVAHPHTFMPPFVVSLLFNASLLPCLNWYSLLSFFFFSKCVRNLELFGREFRSIQANNKFLLLFTCFFEKKNWVFLP